MELYHELHDVLLLPGDDRRRGIPDAVPTVRDEHTRLLLQQLHDLPEGPPGDVDPGVTVLAR